MPTRTSRWMPLFAFAALLAAPAVSQAGPPLICLPFDIGAETSLPWAGGSSWNSPDTRYDVTRLTADTMRELSRPVPVVVRMETLRRATIYAARDPRVANELLATLMTRAAVSMARREPDAVAIFDAGYLIETFRQADHLFNEGRSAPAGTSRWWLRGEAADDGYQLVRRALLLTNGDPDMEFAASLMRQGAEADGHRRRAQAGVARSPLLARNLANR